MKYFANYEADAVIRENDKGERFKKTIDNLVERGPVSQEDRAAWGIPSFGFYNLLEPITKEEYDGFGVTWDWSPDTAKKRILKK